MDRKARHARAGPNADTTKQAQQEHSMSSWLERQLSSHQIQLAATALVSGITVAGLIYGGQAVRRKIAVEQLKASIPPLDDEHKAEGVRLVSL